MAAGLGGGVHICALGGCLAWEPADLPPQQERRQAERYPCEDIAGSGGWCCLFDTVTNMQGKDRWPVRTLCVQITSSEERFLVLLNVFHAQ